MDPFTIKVEFLALLAQGAARVRAVLSNNRLIVGQPVRLVNDTLIFNVPGQGTVSAPAHTVRLLNRC